MLNPGDDRGLGLGLASSVLKCTIKHFLTRYTVKNGISNLYILLKSALKMQEILFQRPKFQNISGGACPRTSLELRRHYSHPLTKILPTPLGLAFQLGSDIVIV